LLKRPIAAGLDSNKSLHLCAVDFINTSLQRGVLGAFVVANRFSGLWLRAFKKPLKRLHNCSLGITPR
jgi:hypothetical protein